MKRYVHEAVDASYLDDEFEDSEYEGVYFGDWYETLPVEARRKVDDLAIELGYADEDGFFDYDELTDEETANLLNAYDNLQ